MLLCPTGRLLEGPPIITPPPLFFGIASVFKSEGDRPRTVLVLSVFRQEKVAADEYGSTLTFSSFLHFSCSPSVSLAYVPPPYLHCLLALFVSLSFPFRCVFTNFRPYGFFFSVRGVFPPNAALIRIRRCSPASFSLAHQVFCCEYHSLRSLLNVSVLRFPFFFLLFFAYWDSFACPNGRGFAVYLFVTRDWMGLAAGCCFRVLVQFRYSFLYWLPLPFSPKACVAKIHVNRVTIFYFLNFGLVFQHFPPFFGSFVTVPRDELAHWVWLGIVILMKIMFKLYFSYHFFYWTTLESFPAE